MDFNNSKAANPALKAVSQRSGGVAQLGEHLLCKQGVESSILFISTKEVKTSGTRDEGTEKTIWAHSSGG